MVRSRTEEAYATVAAPSRLLLGDTDAPSRSICPLFPNMPCQTTWNTPNHTSPFDSLETSPSQSSTILKPSSVSFSHPVRDHIDAVTSISIWFRCGPRSTRDYLALLTRRRNHLEPHTRSTFSTTPGTHSPLSGSPWRSLNSPAPSRTILPPFHHRPPAFRTHTSAPPPFGFLQVAMHRPHPIFPPLSSRLLAS